MPRPSTACSNGGFRGHQTGSGDTILISNIATPFGTRPRATIGNLVDRAPLTQTHRVRSRVPYEGKCVASIEVGPTACFNRSAQLNLAFCNQYRRWDLNPHPHYSLDGGVFVTNSSLFLGRGVECSNTAAQMNDSPRETMARVRAVAPPITSSLSSGRGLG
jgi:hypothetical protein